jgi:hypothetical protein
MMIQGYFANSWHKRAGRVSWKLKKIVATPKEVGVLTKEASPTTDVWLIEVGYPNLKI